ncbi:ABC transporter ATP-binding protein [soil metagenome]
MAEDQRPEAVDRPIAADAPAGKQRPERRRRPDPVERPDPDDRPRRRPKAKDLPLPKDRPLSIRVQDLKIDYEIFEDRRAALRQRIVTRSGPGRSLVHAIRGISLDVYEGDSIGVIGSNGSGKSTLLAAIAGVLPITEGEILVAEEPKLLGVGDTLLPGASGLRNIRLGCLALGMTSHQVDESIDEIVEFTQLGEAINRPLRTYSSGMRARLQFAIATSVHPRILLIDEALAVGDRAFRRRSEERMRNLLSEAGTLVVVSHNLNELSRQCTRGLWIEQGYLRAEGDIDDVIEQYSEHVA